MTHREIDYSQLHDFVWTEEDEPIAVNISLDVFDVELQIIGPDIDSILAALRQTGTDEYLAALALNLESL